MSKIPPPPPQQPRLQAGYWSGDRPRFSPDGRWRWDGTAWVAATLDEQIAEYGRRGFQLVERTPDGARMVKPRSFSLVWALIWLLLFGVGLLVYLVYYLTKSDEVVHLSEAV